MFPGASEGCAAAEASLRILGGEEDSAEGAAETLPGWFPQRCQVSVALGVPAAVFDIAEAGREPMLPLSQSLIVGTQPAG